MPATQNTTPGPARLLVTLAEHITRHDLGDTVDTAGLGYATRFAVRVFDTDAMSKLRRWAASLDKVAITVEPHASYLDVELTGQIDGHTARVNWMAFGAEANQLRSRLGLATPPTPAPVDLSLLDAPSQTDVGVPAVQ